VFEVPGSGFEVETAGYESRTAELRTEHEHEL